MAISVNLAFDDPSGASSPICSKAFIYATPWVRSGKSGNREESSSFLKQLS
jgi:hypothetical protein